MTSTISIIGSDHRIVLAKIRLSLRKCNTPPKHAKRKQYGWKALSSIRNLQELYTIKVRNRFQLLKEENDSASESYEKFIEANKEATESFLKRNHAGHVFSSDPIVTKAREEINW